MFSGIIFLILLNTSKIIFIEVTLETVSLLALSAEGDKNESIDELKLLVE
tara:strand:+ start:454 stop:603 length:150 start_codon:yes stop_codon:yes gene_type:complete